MVESQDPIAYAKWLEWCLFIVTEPAPEVVRQAGQYFRDQLRSVDVALRDGRTYLMGDQFTTADILLTTCLIWAIDYGVGICDNAVRILSEQQQDGPTWPP